VITSQIPPLLHCLSPCYNALLKKKGIENLNDERVTPKKGDTINSINFLRIGRKTTICLMTLNNGFEIVGSSACVNPDDYEYNQGCNLAKKNAMQKLEIILAYYEHQQNFYSDVSKESTN